MSRKRRVTHAQVFEAIKRCPTVHRAPTIAEYREWYANENAPSVAEINRIFGDWISALERAGCEPVHGLRGCSELKDVQESLRAASKKLDGKPMSYVAYRRVMEGDPRQFHISVVRRYYETWVNACQMLGITPGQHKTRIEKDEALLKDVRRVGDKKNAGHPPTSRFYREHRAAGAPTWEKLSLLWGGWGEVLKAAGYSEEAIFDWQIEQRHPGHTARQQVAV
jgi:hypothetical protein